MQVAQHRHFSLWFNAFPFCFIFGVGFLKCYFFCFFFFIFFCFFFFFFFSSRRRHTRSLRDWSSDVCSSDLPKIHLVQSLIFLLLLPDVLTNYALIAAHGGHEEPSCPEVLAHEIPDRKSTRLNSSHVEISYAVFCLKKKIVLSSYST